MAYDNNITTTSNADGTPPDHNFEKKPTFESTIHASTPEGEGEPTITPPQPTAKWHHHLWFNLQIWWALLFHLCLCLSIALSMVLALDDYLALTASQPRPPRSHFRLRASDITTIISGGLVLVRVTVESWAAVTVWRCAFALLEQKAVLSIPALNDLMSWPRLPRRIPKKTVGWAVGITLLFIFPQSYLSPLLAGSVDWQPAYQLGGTVGVVYPTRPENSVFSHQEQAEKVLEQNTGREYTPYSIALGTPRERWDWAMYNDAGNAPYFRQSVALRAVRHAAMLWKTGEHSGEKVVLSHEGLDGVLIANGGDNNNNNNKNDDIVDGEKEAEKLKKKKRKAQRQRTCRFLMEPPNDIIIPKESILYNATLPCISIHSITWGTTYIQNEFPPSSAFYDYRVSPFLSATGAEMIFAGAYPGNAILFAKNQRWPTFPIRNVSIPYPSRQVLRQERNLFIKLGATVRNSTGNGVTCTNPEEALYPVWGNISHVGKYVNSPQNQTFPYCLAHAKVTFTAGSLLFPRSKFLGDNVVEGIFPPGKKPTHNQVLEKRDNNGGDDDFDGDVIHDSDWIEDMWAADALNLLPAIMDRVSEMNSSAIPTWNDIDGYVEKLIRTSYLASWAALRQTMSSLPASDTLPPPLSQQEDPSASADRYTLTAVIAHERLQAKVDKVRVFVWLGVSLLLQLSGVVWYFGAQKRSRDNKVVIDGHIAALLTNPEKLGLVESSLNSSGGESAQDDSSSEGSGKKRSKQPVLKAAVVGTAAGATAGATVAAVVTGAVV